MLLLNFLSEKMNEHDEKLLQWAKKQRWEDLDESMAEPEEGKRWRHTIITTNYHNEEYERGIM